MTKLDFEMSVKRALREKKMTQAQLAEKIGVTAAYCSDIIRGNRTGEEQRKKIIKILELKK